jgi:hypothetical protein
VEKGQTRTHIRGEGWKRFIAKKWCHQWRKAIFSLIEVPRISVIYVGDGEEDPLKSTIILQRCNLTGEQEDHMLDMLPPTFVLLVY